MRRKFHCPICKINICPRSHRYCNICHAKYMREWRKTHPLNIEQRKKMNVHSYAHVYFKRGKIIKEPCIICGDINSQMHHPDYNKPLLVEWYCRKHHLKLHRDVIRNSTLQ